MLASMQVAVMPNTLAFNHGLAALETAAARDVDQREAPLLAEHAVKLFYSMQNRAGSPPDRNTYDLVMAVLSKTKAEGQALHVYQLKLQRVCTMIDMICDPMKRLHTWQNIYAYGRQSMPSEKIQLTGQLLTA